MKKLLAIILTVSILSSCEDELAPDLEERVNLLVVDGWIYNTPGPQTVRVARSVAFEDTQNLSQVTGAVVIVRNRNLEDVRLTEISPGLYQTDENFQGQVGQSYQVEIRPGNGRVYLSDFQTLRPVPEILTLSMELDETSTNNPDFLPEQFFPVTIVQDFPESVDFYRWKVARNEEFFNEPEDIILLTDRFINGNRFRNELKEYLFLEGDTVHVRLESMTQEAYNFLRFFRRQTTDLGTSGGTNPGVLQGNLRNRDDENEVVLGFFGASAVTTIQQTVEE
ncbi:MAG: DUF4249 domain-containing protein [Bacteroidota bacterium]